MKPDFESALFQTMTYSERDVVFMRGATGVDEGREDASSLSRQRLVRNRITGHLPTVLHFNGGEKRLLKEWWGKMWWVTGGEGENEEREATREWVKEKVRRGGVRVAGDGRWVGWEELGCEGEGSVGG